MIGTNSWLNISCSIEKLLREWMQAVSPSTQIYRRRVPGDVAEQRALVGTGTAFFFQIDPGDIDQVQDTYCKLCLCERQTQQAYTPSQNLKGIWTHQMYGALSLYLNHGDPAYARWFPLYDYQTLIDPTYVEFLQTNNPALLNQVFTLTPLPIQGTGFVVRAGHSTPKLIFNEDPLKVEWTVTFQHWNPDVYCAQRG